MDAFIQVSLHFFPLFHLSSLYIISYFSLKPIRLLNQSLYTDIYIYICIFVLLLYIHCEKDEATEPTLFSQRDKFITPKAFSLGCYSFLYFLLGLPPHDVATPLLNLTNIIKCRGKKLFYIIKFIFLLF